MIIAIIGAMDEEISRLCKTFKAINIDKNFDIYKGNYNDFELYVCKCGIGKVNAAIAAQRIIDFYKPDYIINTGIAGGLDKALSTLDIVLSKCALYHDLKPASLIETDCKPYQSKFFADDKLLECASEVCCECVKNKMFSAYKIGNVVSGDCFVEDSKLSAYIREELGGVCVEMEGAAIAHACVINKIPFLIVRSISDFADENAVISYEKLKEQSAENACIIIEKILDKLR